MLSVQSAGCAGMERLGVPARTSLNTPPDDRGHISRRMRVDTIQSRDLLVRDTTLLSDRQIRNNNHLHQYHRVGCGSSSSSYSICNSSNIRVGIDAATIMTAKQQQQTVAAKLKPINNDRNHHQQQVQQQQQIRCPHHIPLPDSEWGQDRDLQIRARYQQSEITRSYIKPPPNKTVLDVPEQSYNFYSSTTLSSSANSGISCNLRTNVTNQHSSYHNNYHLQHQQQPCTSGTQQQSAISTQQQQKSKPSVITKLFSRKNSPKSPTALCSSSSISSNSSLSSSSGSSSSSSASSSSSSSPSSSSVSTSSSSSSLCSAQALPISIAATLTATTCSLGAAAPIQNNLMPTSCSNITSSSSFLTTIGATAGTRVSPSPPLAVTVPVATCSGGMLQQQQFHLQQQQLIVDSTNSSNLSSTSLHLLKNSNCNLSSTTVAACVDAPLTSIDCCYTQATSIHRSHSISQPTKSSLSQQQQSIDNCVNSNSSSSSSISSNNSSNNYQHHI